MTSNYVQLPPQSTGLKVDTNELTVGGNTVERQNVALADPATAAAVAQVLNSSPAGTEYGLVTRVLPPTLTKGTQGTLGVTTQDLKDSGRVHVLWTVSGLAATAASEAVLTVTESRDGATTTSHGSYTITSGKRFRITSLTAGFELTTNTTSTNVSRNRIRLRFNTAGAVTTSSALVYVATAPSLTGSAKTTVDFFEDFPDGLEFLGDGTKQIAVTWESPDWVTSAQVTTLYLSMFGFEY